MHVKSTIILLLFTISINYGMEESLPLHTIINNPNLGQEQKIIFINQLFAKNKEVNVNQRDDVFGLTPLDCAATLPNHHHLILTLRKAGADPYLENSKQECSVIIAINRCLSINVEALLHGIPNNPKVIPTNINWLDQSGRNFLDYTLTSKNALENKGKNLYSSQNHAQICNVIKTLLHFGIVCKDQNTHNLLLDCLNKFSFETNLSKNF